jgi:glycosyltransferase involved in cell wall biosynthesis
MQALSCCVIIPTYNNAATLQKVIDGVRQYCSDIIVVNDGSTDQTTEILKQCEGIDIVHFPKNKGKGIALKKGFRYAFSKGYANALTIDSDGQHMPEDIINFVEKAERHPGSIIIGARNMMVDNVPKKSSFGRRFSNFWFRFETGKKVPDTQSGYRLYPLKSVCGMWYFTGRYEFEIEVIVRSSWKGIEITSVPVKVFYAPEGERVSHFKPFYDFTRVSLLNTWLVLISLLLIRPFRFVKALNRRNIREFFTRHVLKPDESNFKKALSVTVGVFLGIIPIWGWQIATAIVVSIFFKLNRMMTIVSSNISIPPMIPVIVYGSYLTGGLVVHKNAVKVDYSPGITLNDISTNFFQYLVGSIILAFVASLFFGLLTYVLLVIFRKSPTEKNNQQQSGGLQKQAEESLMKVE